MNDENQGEIMKKKRSFKVGKNEIARFIRMKRKTREKIKQ